MKNPLSTLWYKLTNNWVAIYRQRYGYSDDYLTLGQMLGWGAIGALNVPHVPYPTLMRVLRRNSIYPDFRYRHFTRPKADGTLRQLVEPDEKLKRIQRKILKTLLKNASIHPSAVGFRRKKSTADHAWSHAGAATIITADIEDFFPQTKTHRVEAWWKNYFIEQPEAESAARLLTLLTTYKGSLPQGAPTSPTLSNILNYDMDAALERRVVASGGRYTRYCDDMAFSWGGIGDVPSDFEAAVRSIVQEYGYHLHRWEVWNAQDEPELTGIILARHGGVELPNDVQQTMRRLARSSSASDAARLQGYRAYESMVKKRR